MAASNLVAELLATPDSAEQQQFLATHCRELDDTFAQALKDAADRFLRSDSGRALAAAELLLYAGDLTQNSASRALGLLAKANTLAIGLGDYPAALALYNEATEIYRVADRPVEQARSQIGKIHALAWLGRYDEAEETGRWASAVLDRHAEWRSLATLTMNLAVLHARRGDDRAALATLDRASEIYRRLGSEGAPFLPWVENNRAIVLRNLGQFDAAIATSQVAVIALTQAGQIIEAARSRQALAITYFALGRYNEALQLLNEVRDVFVADGRQRDAILVDLFTSDCLLELRRFTDVLEKCLKARELFDALGSHLEVGQTILNEAVAYAGLARYESAYASLAEARRHFAKEGNIIWEATTDLAQASILLRQGALAEIGVALDALDALGACIAIFQRADLTVRAAEAQVISARVAIACGDFDWATTLVTEALAFGQSKGLAALTYQCNYVLGTIAQARGTPTAALDAYGQAIADLEQMRGRLMVEFRVEFLEDKAAVYEDAVMLCVALDRPAVGLDYAERAKSRALLDLVAHRLDLGVRARSAADVPLVEQLVRLRAERDRVYRRWETQEEVRTRGRLQQVQQEVLALERQITELWHRLLIANADYARDVGLWQVHTEAVQPHLPPNTALLEYFIAHQQVIAFLVTADSVQAWRLPDGLTALQQTLQLLWLNLRSAPQVGANQIKEFAINGRSLLRRLHQMLIAPVADAVPPSARLIIVPHGPLHYLPFQALHDGQRYLVERHEISYLPGASLLRYCCDKRAHGSKAAAFGYSWEGHLPQAVTEAQTVANLLGGVAIVEEAATITNLQRIAGDCRILHMATHGEFRPDSPLFSGLALADGWLTTLDIFGLRLTASLVTLSACQTGKNVVGAGDELLGLMRAFLYAGTASLLLTHWPVEDVAAAEFMAAFYRRLAGGATKSAALRETQMQFLHGDAGIDYVLPYFWAPFLLVGHPGPL